MQVASESIRRRVAESREFLTRLWNLENEERPGFIIGDVGGKVSGGRPVRSALFSTEGADTVRDRLLDPEKFLRAQIQEMEGMQERKGDFVPALCPALGVVGIPSAFGCEVIWWENAFPAVRQLAGNDPERVMGLNAPRVTDGELGRVLRYTEFFIQETHSAYPIRQTDVQGPLDSASLVFGPTNFLAAMYSNPHAVHHFMELVTELTIELVRAQRTLVRKLGAEFVPSMFQPWIPDGLGVSVSNDECALISSAMHDEFSLPYLNRISDAFGGIYIHSCGRWAHQIPSLKKVRNLRGLEFGASEAPFEPVIEEFAGKTVLAARIGLHRDIKFDGMADFIRRIRRASRTNRGLFIHADITNGIVDENWPMTDLDEIYRLVGYEKGNGDAGTAS